MMEKVGDILSASSGIVVQGCNAQGKMNSGLAKQIRSQYPEVYDVYAEQYKKHGLRLGEVIWAAPTENRQFWIANAITQKFYGRDPLVRYVDYSAIEVSLREIASFAKEKNLFVHLPRIGAGLGNGDWDVISKIIARELADVPHQLWLHPLDVPSRPSPKV